MENKKWTDPLDGRDDDFNIFVHKGGIGNWNIYDFLGHIEHDVRNEHCPSDIIDTIWKLRKFVREQERNNQTCAPR